MSINERAKGQVITCGAASAFMDDRPSGPSLVERAAKATRALYARMRENVASK